MPDIITTLGVDTSEQRKGLTEAVRDYDRYSKEIERIDRRYGAAAATEFRKILDTQRAARDEQNRFVRAAGRGAAMVRQNWATIGAVFAATGAGVTAGLAVAERAIGRYAERYDFAEARLRRFMHTHDRAMNQFQRNMFIGFSSANPESAVNTISRGYNAFTNFAANLFRDVGNMTQGGPGGVGQSMLDFAMGRSRPTTHAQQIDAAYLSAEQADIANRRMRTMQQIRRADRARVFADQGMVGAAAIENARIERDNALRTLGQQNLTVNQRQDAIGAIERSFDAIVQRMSRVDGSLRAEGGLRSRSIRADDGTAWGGFVAREAAILAEAEAAARAITTGDATEADRARALEDLRVETQRRIDALQREVDLQDEIAQIERRRVDLVGQTGFDARRRAAASDAELARARARGEITDPGLLETELARIDATERAALAGVDREETGQRTRFGDTMAGLRIERLRRQGRTAEAERAAIRLRFGQMERDLVDSLGPDGGGMLAGLREEMERALADVGMDRAGTRASRAVAPELLGGFRGVRDRLGVDRNTQLLQQIADNSKNTVTFQVR